MNPAKQSGGKPNGQPKKPLVWQKNTFIHELVSWATVDPTAIRGGIDAVTKAGGAIMFGLTSDGGAYSICVLLEQYKLKEYPHSSDECAEVLRKLTEHMADML